MEMEVRPRRRRVMEMLLDDGSVEKRGSIPIGWKGGVKLVEPFGREEDGAACRVAPGPAQRFDAGKKRPAQTAGQMRAALAPIETFAADSAARAVEGRKIDAEGFEKRCPALRYVEAGRGDFE